MDDSSVTGTLVLGYDLKLPLYYIRTQQTQMSKDLLITMLKKGENGDEILAILDAISTESDEIIVPTLDEIAF